MKSEKSTHYSIPSSFFALILLLSSLSQLNAEYLSFKTVSFFEINTTNVNAQQYSLGPDDAVIIKLEEHIHSFIGVDIEISQSKPSPLSLFLYSLEDMSGDTEKKCKVKEIVKEDIQKKNGTFRVPYDEKIKCAQDVTVKILSCVINEKNAPLLLKCSPSLKSNMKGKLNVRVKPILQDLGGIRFNLIYPTNVVYFPSLPKNETEMRKNISVRLDDKHITDFSKPCMTRLGEHKIQVDSHFYKSEVVTCIVEKGKIELIDIKLKPLAPLIVVEGPSNIEVYFDNQAIRLPFSANVEAGEHILRFKMEGYEATRNITAEQGKKYLLNLSLEINISEKSL